MTNIYNFALVSENLATAGQPSEEQLQDIAGEGYQTVINLGLPDPRYCLEDEAGLVQSLGMDYVHIPVDFQAPTLADLEQFFQAMDMLKDKKVFVHCAANYRVSSFVSLYGQARLGWDSARAESHIQKLWQPNETWRNFIDAARQQLGIRE